MRTHFRWQAQRGPILPATFACLLLAAPLLRGGQATEPDAADSPARDGQTVCVALGAGGANGLAHVPLLEVFDELGIRPRAISGASVGAVVGALYASGMSAREIRRLILEYFVMPEEDLLERLVSGEALRWMDFIEVELGDGGLLGSERFMSFLYKKLESRSFEELDIPLQIVAADLWIREEVIFESGELLPAIRASMALPGVFEPVANEGRVLIDGGAVNPVPWDLLPADCDVTVAVDVSGVRTRPESDASYFEVVFNSVKVMQQAIVAEKRRSAEPTLFLAPQIRDIRALEFYRAERVFEQARASADELRGRLRALQQASSAN